MVMSVWVPKQYGAWAMLVAPVLTGAILGGFGWGPFALAVAWIAAYLAYMAGRGALAGRHGRQSAAAVAAYGGLTLTLVVGLLVWRAALLWWAIPLAVLLGISLAMVVARRERSTLNDAALIGASALMCAVVATSARLTPTVTWSDFAHGVAWPTAWLATAVLAGYFWGTIPYVKTMIRERRKPGWYAASVAYHAVLIVPACLVNWWIAGFAVLAAARAALVPKLWPQAKPRHIGAAEVVATVALVAILAVTLPR